MMTGPLRNGCYLARFAVTADDILAAQRLRHLCFVEHVGGPCRPGNIDSDDFDPLCRHVLVEDAATGRLVCCFRLLPLCGGAEIGRSYSAQYYDLSGLRDYAGPLVEMGRFCIHPDLRDADILRIAWGTMTRYVDENAVEMLFGCASFAGIEADRYLDAFALLTASHLAPQHWLPRIKAPTVFRFANRLRHRVIDRKRALLALPPLLRTYLVMGGWVSDHAVVDTDLNTIHVFTGLEIRAIPPGRAKALRVVAGAKNIS